MNRGFIFTIQTLAATTFCMMSANATIIVNSLEDVEVPVGGEVTLRSALALAASGEPIVFDSTLDGDIIELSIVGEEHSTLVAELMGIDDTPIGPVSYLIGYFERDYGRSALYAHKDVVIDASALPHGITVRWGGGDEDPARVLAVYGNLTMRNVSITGGRSVSVALVPDPEAVYPQLSTRARGGGLAVWGTATLDNCRLFDNACFQPWNMQVRDSREGGVFGGGIYADVVQISDSVISGNALTGAGVSGGGVFSVGGRTTDYSVISTIVRSAVSGNTIAGIHAYGGGVYSDGGGIGRSKYLFMLNCTVAANEVGIYGPAFLYGIGYWRGGGIYMSNGSMSLAACTIVDNAVTGVARIGDLGKPSLAGGIAATTGNAHAVGSMDIGHCIIGGNWVHPSGGASYNEDIFTGSLSGFVSRGYNCIGTINFDQMLAPSCWWHTGACLSRKAYPKEGDKYGIILDDVIDRTNGTTRAPDILSLGVDAPQKAVIYYMPKGNAVDQVPAGPYNVFYFSTTYYETSGPTGPNYDNLTQITLDRIEAEYGLSGFASAFTSDFEAFLASVDIDGDESNGLQPYTTPDGDPILTLGDALWYGPEYDNWPSLLENYPWIEFWHRLDTALKTENIPELGPALLNEEAWNTMFDDGEVLGNGIEIEVYSSNYKTQLTSLDQNQTARPVNSFGDVGAIEYVPPTPWGKYVRITSQHGNFADTSDWLGILEISFDPWVWCALLDCWVNIPEQTASAGNGWVHVPPSEESSLWIVQIDGTDWGYSFALNKWLYLTASGWLYMI